MTNAFKGIMGYVERRAKKSPQFYTEIHRIYARKARWAPLLSPFLALSNAPPAPRRFVFLGDKYIDLILGLRHQGVLVLADPQPFIRSILRRVPAVSTLQYYAPLTKIFEGQRDDDELERAAGLLRSLYAATSPEWVVVDNDSLPLQRFIVEVAKECGVKTLCIQHGAFQTKNSSGVNDGEVVDLFLALDDFQAEIVARGGLPRSKIHAFGYHSEVHKYCDGKNVVPGSIKKSALCILGQAWDKVSKDAADRYLSLLPEVAYVARSAGYEVIFKPHPWENGAAASHFDGRVFRGSISDAIRKFDCFVSFTSTALLEASMHGKASIQIYDKTFDGDRFEDIGYAYTVDATNLSDLSRLLQLSAPFVSDRLAFMTRYGVAERFLEAIS